MKEIFKDITDIVTNPSVKKFFILQFESVAYFIENSERILKSDYIPTNDDILHARQRTTGVAITKFIREKYEWVLCDVGGQINERKKWNNIVRGRDLHAIIFCASLTDFDLHERNPDDVDSKQQNSVLDDSLELFSTMLKSPWTGEKAIIIFLNKTDLFNEKLKKIKFSQTFPEYKGDQEDVKGCLQFITGLFNTIATKADRKVVIHPTCALDTKAFKVVLNSVTTHVTDHRLKSVGLPV